MINRLLLPLLLTLSGLVYAANPQTGCAELAANQAQPHVTINAADRCVTNLLAGQLTINFASNANLTLTNSQWQYATLRLTDTGPVLSTGRDVIYPNVDSYTGGTSRATFYFVNSTAQTLTVKRSGQTGVAVTAGSSALLHHNGTDVEAISSGGGGGGAPSDATFITQTANGALSNEQAMGALSTGIVKNTATTGVQSIAAQGTDYYAPGGTDVAFADGGTGLSSASDDQTLVSSGSAWVVKTLPDCTDTGGNHLNYTQSTNAFSCGTSGGGGGSPGGSNTQVQYNASGSFAGEADFAWNATTNSLAIGSAGTPGFMTAPAVGANANGTTVNVRGGPGGATSGSGGELNILGGEPGANGNGGAVNVIGGTGVAGNGGGSLNLAGGNGGTGSQGGIVTITGGTSPSGTPGYIDFVLNGGSVYRMTSFGGFSVSGSEGTSGQVLTSQGASTAPAWGTPGATSGGTGQTTVTQGDLLYGSAANTWSKLAKNASATRYLANTGTTNNPAWAQVNVANGVTGTLPQANRLRAVRTITAAGAVTGAATDEIICVNKTVGAATTVNLHSSPATGFEYTIKDCKGDAGTNNITVTPAAGNIDGSVSYVISANYGAVRLFYNGSQWFSW